MGSIHPPPMLNILVLSLVAAANGSDAQPPEAPPVRSAAGTPLKTCSKDPATGWFRDGTCRTGPRDRGVHVVCAKVTAAFLQFSKDRGNDLFTASPEHRFPGLKAGDRWCLCAARWAEAEQAGVAPPVLLEASHEKVLDLVPEDTLKDHAIEASKSPSASGGQARDQTSAKVR
jgi:uncharacterized protein